MTPNSHVISVVMRQYFGEPFFYPVSPLAHKLLEFSQAHVNRNRKAFSARQMKLAAEMGINIQIQTMVDVIDV